MVLLLKMSDTEVTIHEDSKSVIEIPRIREERVSEFANLVHSLSKSVIDGFENFEINENNLVDYIVRVMQIVEKQKQLSGIEKKNVAIEILLRVVDGFDNLTSENKQHVKLLIKTLAPSVIDTIISATKGALSVNKKVEEASRKCFSYCC
jgi:hypothetical protein